MATTARISTQRAAAIEKLKIEAIPQAIIGFTRKATEDLLKSVPEIGAFERKRILGAIEVKGRVGKEYAETAIERLTALQMQFGQPTITLPEAATGIPFGEYEIPNVRYAPQVAEAIAGLIRNIIEQAAAYTKMGELGQEEGLSLLESTKYHTKALEDNTRALNKLIDKMAMPGIVPILLNTGMVD